MSQAEHTIGSFNNVRNCKLASQSNCALLFRSLKVLQPRLCRPMPIFRQWEARHGGLPTSALSSAASPGKNNKPMLSVESLSRFVSAGFSHCDGSSKIKASSRRLAPSACVWQLCARRRISQDAFDG